MSAFYTLARSNASESAVIILGVVLESSGMTIQNVLKALIFQMLTHSLKFQSSPIRLQEWSLHFRHRQNGGKCQRDFPVADLSRRGI